MGGQEKAKTSILSRHLLKLDAHLDIRRNFITNHKIEIPSFVVERFLLEKI